MYHNNLTLSEPMSTHLSEPEPQLETVTNKIDVDDEYMDADVFDESCQYDENRRIILPTSNSSVHDAHVPSPHQSPHQSPHELPQQAQQSQSTLSSVSPCFQCDHPHLKEYSIKYS